MEDLVLGILGCAGEECFGGTISRLAVRKILEERRPGKMCSLCLPLYLAGGEEERKFAQKHPVITIDGCSKLCAKKSTEKYSGSVADWVDVSQIIGNAALSKVISEKDFMAEHYALLEELTDAVCKKFDVVFEEEVKKNLRGEI